MLTKAERDEMRRKSLSCNPTYDRGLLLDSHDEADKRIEELEAERDTWRRVAERLENEKVEARAEVERLKAALVPEEGQYE